MRSIVPWIEKRSSWTALFRNDRFVLLSAQPFGLDHSNGRLTAQEVAAATSPAGRK